MGCKLGAHNGTNLSERKDLLTWRWGRQPLVSEGVSQAQFEVGHRGAGGSHVCGQEAFWLVIRGQDMSILSGLHSY